jgi:hypothetical protein
MRTGYQPTVETGQHGLNLVISALIKRGARTIAEQEAQNLLYVWTKNDPQPIEIRTKTKGPTSRDWQVSAAEGIPPHSMVDEREFWILVDLAESGAATFYILPGRWFRQALAQDHLTPLDAHGGERAVTRERIRQFEERWDLLPL